MKKIMLSVVAVSLGCLSMGALAEKIIHDVPAVIEERDNVFIPVVTRATPDNEGYFTIEDTGKELICYRDARPVVAGMEDAGILPVKLGNKIVKLHCYDYTADYFEMP